MKAIFKIAKEKPDFYFIGLPKKRSSANDLT